jgi:polyisoprenoid-binding protein YceI
MKRMVSAGTWAALALLAIAAPALAADPFKIDPAHSQVSFTIRHFFSRVTGRFNEFSGNIQLDEKSLGNSSVDATITTASIFTGQERRDNHLRSPDFFWADSFPTLSFKSTKVTPGEGNKFKLAGDLTMRGVTRPVVLDGTFLGAGAVAMGGQPGRYLAGFEATGTVNRKDFNISWNKTLDQGGTMLGDDVTITLAVEAAKAEPGREGMPPGTAKKPGGN